MNFARNNISKLHLCGDNVVNHRFEKRREDLIKKWKCGT